MQQTNATPANETMTRHDPDVAELRKAAAHLTEEAEQLEELANLPTMKRRLLGALIEHAFPETPSRGLAHAEELEDIERYLLACSLADDEESDHRLLATVGTWLASGGREEAEVLPLVRAIAIYFARWHADGAARVLHPDFGCFDADGNRVPRKGDSDDEGALQ